MELGREVLLAAAIWSVPKNWAVAVGGCLSALRNIEKLQLGPERGVELAGAKVPAWAPAMNSQKGVNRTGGRIVVVRGVVNVGRDETTLRIALSLMNLSKSAILARGRGATVVGVGDGFSRACRSRSGRGRRWR